MFCSPGMNIPAFVRICNYFQNSMCTYHDDVLVPHVYLQGPMYVYRMYTYQDLCPWIINIYMYILTRTNVIGSYVYLPGPMSLDHLLTRTYPWIRYLPGPLSIDYTSTYQGLCPWIICMFARTYVLGLYIYLPGPWIIHILTRTYVLGIYIFYPGPMFLDHMYTYQDRYLWKKR